MKKALLLALVLTLGATMAFAQNGSIGIFADTQGTNCNLPSTGFVTLNFFHVNAVGATASQWASPAPACVTGARLADLPVFAVNLGTTSAGITIGYGACKTGTFLIMQALYNMVAATPCCYWSVVADPNLSSGKIEIPDCNFDLTYGTGMQGIVSSAPNCNCNVPANETTWGQMKALYE